MALRKLFWQLPIWIFSGHIFRPQKSSWNIISRWRSKFSIGWKKNHFWDQRNSFWAKLTPPRSPRWPPPPPRPPLGIIPRPRPIPRKAPRPRPRGCFDFLSTFNIGAFLSMSGRIANRTWKFLFIFLYKIGSSRKTRAALSDARYLTSANEDVAQVRAATVAIGGTDVAKLNRF